MEDNIKYVILLIILAFLSNINIGIGLLFLGVIILFIYKKEQYESKLDIIKPELNIGNSNSDCDSGINDELIKFVFSVQDFYVFNPAAYDEFVESINSFKNIYDTIFSGKGLANYNYQLAENERKNILNSFHSLIYNLPPSKPHNSKFNESLERLEGILNVYMNNLYDRCVDYAYCNANVTTRPINRGPAEYNTFDYDNFTYEIF